MVMHRIANPDDAGSIPALASRTRIYEMNIEDIMKFGAACAVALIFGIIVGIVSSVENEINPEN